MPMLTMLRIGFPVCPVHSPDRIRSANAPIRPSTSCTSGTTSAPSVVITSPSRRAQRNVQHRAVLGDVDVLAAEHGRPQLGQVRLLRQRDQQVDRLGGDPVLGVVEIDALGLQRQVGAAAARRRRTARSGWHRAASRSAAAGPGRPGADEGVPGRCRSWWESTGTLRQAQSVARRRCLSVRSAVHRPRSG